MRTQNKMNKWGERCRGGLVHEMRKDMRVRDEGIELRQRSYNV